MKKLLVLAFILVFIATAFTVLAAETTISGTYRIRSIMDYNYDKQLRDTTPVILTPLYDNSRIGHDKQLYTGYFDQRFRIKITHTRSEFLKAEIIADIVEDTWGQQRNLRWNNSTGAAFGWISGAYIEAITPIGMIRAGGRGGLDKFGFGIWSDSGMKGDGSDNYGITYAIMLPVGDAKIAASLSYIKYVDLAMPVLANLAGVPANDLTTWPGRPTLDAIGGSGSTNYNIDTDTFVLTAHYITDDIKAGVLLQWVMDPRAIGAGMLAKGVISHPVMPNGSSFRGEAGQIGLYGPFGPIVTFNPVAGPAFNPITMPLWPNPVFAWPGALGDAIWNPGYNFGLGMMGMYGVNIYVAGIYADMKFFDDKLQIKGEFDRIWGAAHINAYGRGYNAFLNDVATATLGVTPGPTTMGGWPTTIVFTNLLPGQKIPEKIGVDSTNIYVDISYNTDLFTVGAAFLYGSGEKWGHPFTQHHLGLNTTGNSDFHWSNIVVAGDWERLNSIAPLGLGDNQENVTSVKFYWAVRPFEDLDIHGTVLWAKYTEPVGRYAMDENMNLVSNYHAFYGHPMNYVLLAGNHTYIPANVDDDLGWELDFGITWTIMEGLSLNSEFGVLFTGDAFDYRNTETGAREEWGEIYRWVNTLTYEF